MNENHEINELKDKELQLKLMYQAICFIVNTFVEINESLRLIQIENAITNKNLSEIVEVIEQNN